MSSWQKQIIWDSSQSDLTELIASWDQPDFRVAQIWNGLYKGFWNSPSDFINLPMSLRDKLGEHFFFPGIEETRTITSNDRKTVKYLFTLKDKSVIETVLMTYAKRNTLCISSQVGCAMGCVFCATGHMGFERNLTSGELIVQVLHIAKLLHKSDQVISNIVLMGMGEPFHNYKNVIRAIRCLNQSNGYDLGARRFTISTVGIIPEIKMFISEHLQINLAVSLHAADNDLRSSMIPINKKYPIEDLLDACFQYTESTRRRITFEWAMIDGINDTTIQAKLLTEKLKGMLCHVNLIRLNPTPFYLSEPGKNENLIIFRDILLRAGIPCSVRLRRGIEIYGGCGQLALIN